MNKTLSKKRNDSSIRTIRKAHGLTQTEFGEKLGVERRTVSAWENGELNPRKANINAMQSLFGQQLPSFYDNGKPKGRERTHENGAALSERMLSITPEKSKKLIEQTFEQGKCYHISDKSINSTPSNERFYLRYEKKDGIHHFFREIRGNWIVTYTDAQLIGKNIQEI